MKTADIQVDGVYRAEVGYRRFTKVRVLETRVRRNDRVGRFGPDQWRDDRVRVVLEEPIVSTLRSENVEAGSEKILPSRKILSPWTQEDQDALEDARRLEARQNQIEEILGRAGYAEDDWRNDGQYRWRGEWLEIGGELLDRVVELMKEES